MACINTNIRITSQDHRNRGLQIRLVWPGFAMIDQTAERSSSSVMQALQDPAYQHPCRALSLNPKRPYKCCKPSKPGSSRIMLTTISSLGPRVAGCVDKADRVAPKLICRTALSDRLICSSCSRRLWRDHREAGHRLTVFTALERWTQRQSKGGIQHAYNILLSFSQNCTALCWVHSMLLHSLSCSCSYTFCCIFSQWRPSD